jgi:hypothetical protein
MSLLPADIVSSAVSLAEITSAWLLEGISKHPKTITRCVSTAGDRRHDLQDPFTISASKDSGFRYLQFGMFDAIFFLLQNACIVVLLTAYCSSKEPSQACPLNITFLSHLLPVCTRRVAGARIISNTTLSARTPTICHYRHTRTMLLRRSCAYSLLGRRNDSLNAQAIQIQRRRSPAALVLRADVEICRKKQWISQDALTMTLSDRPFRVVEMTSISRLNLKTSSFLSFRLPSLSPLP